MYYLIIGGSTFAKDESDLSIMRKAKSRGAKRRDLCELCRARRGTFAVFCALEVHFVLSSSPRLTVAAIYSGASAGVNSTYLNLYNRQPLGLVTCYLDFIAGDSLARHLAVLPRRKFGPRFRSCPYS